MSLSDKCRKISELVFGQESLSDKSRCRTNVVLPFIWNGTPTGQYNLILSDSNMRIYVQNRAAKDTVFGTGNFYRNFSRSVHPGEKTIPCNECGDLFITYNSRDKV